MNMASDYKLARGQRKADGRKSLSPGEYAQDDAATAIPKNISTSRPSSPAEATMASMEDEAYDKAHPADQANLKN
jgi:hypothetical protein